MNQQAALDLLFDGPRDADRVIVLAHGAGAPMKSPFMTAFAEGLAARGLRVARFEFPYMAAGRKRPDSGPVLRETWLQVIGSLSWAKRLVIGGKSLGGRIASMVADDARVAGLVCLGYPFHPPGKPDQLRTEHLRTLHTPALILQGTRDPFGGPDDVAGYALSASIRVHWLADGDHSFKPRKSSGRTEQDNWNEGIEAVAAFVEPL